MNLVYDIATGNAVSIGTVVADPLPTGLGVVNLTRSEFDGLRAGTLAWDPATLTLVAVPPDPAVVVEADLNDKLRQHIDANKAALAATPATTTAPRLRDLEQQVARLTRQNNALIRLVMRGDLLDDNEGT